MPEKHPIQIRRNLLLYFYDRYKTDPMEMVGPAELDKNFQLSKQELSFNLHYLYDRKLIELMFGYEHPVFTSARILADGIDLAENHFNLNRLFPPVPGDENATHANIIYLIEELYECVELAPIEGLTRMQQLRDVQFLRDEVAQPPKCWRNDKINTVLEWIEKPFIENTTELPEAITKLKQVLNNIDAQE